MAELDKIPQKQAIEIETVKLDEGVLQSINELNSKLNGLVSQFGEIYLRKKEIQDELIRLDEICEKSEDDFKSLNFKMKEILDSLDEVYPQGRIDMQNGTIQYQPGAPTRKQQADLQAMESQQSSGLKVVKE
jgi:predicted nuclease with TOPRIM domain